jgi:osmotically-inducible protein OsmY
MDLDTAARVEARIQADERQALRHTVRVNVVKGQAELLGEARNAEERQMAETVALQTHGVKEVKNLMTLRR